MKNAIFTFLKGMAMGAADVVPGVSGGTIAFITGIYDQLLTSINSIRFSLVTTFKEDGIKGVWQAVNGKFLLPLFLGIGTSIVSLAKVFGHLLENHPIGVWSFFFGLILASIFLVGKMVKPWGAKEIIGLLAGTTLSYFLTVVSPATVSGSLPYIFLCGAVAICAMILPGISGSFILLLMGAYTLVLSAVSDHNFVIIIVFGLGCMVGILSFSKVLKFLLSSYHSLTVAILTGFLVGSLNKIWPWKITLETFVDRHGEAVPLVQENVLPTQFPGDAQLGMALVLCVVGIAIIWVMGRLAPKIKK